MDIIINGEAQTVSAQSVALLLNELGLDARRIAVELNREILPKTSYADTLLAAGDQLEIVHFVGGG